MTSAITPKRDRILGALWGSLVGDALGVPVEFKDRATRQLDPVTDMRSYGTHRQPAGTWSDDSSLILCSVESLLHSTLDTEDMGRRFVRWYRDHLWTPHGKVFDIGIATADALRRVQSGVRSELAGGDDARSNGNGSLMRIVPVTLRFATEPIKTALDAVHRASSITHRHSRSQLACGLFSLVVRDLLQDLGPQDSIAGAIETFRSFYEAEARWTVEFEHFEAILDGRLASYSDRQIASGGYVIHTLTASLWCLLTTHSFEECVLKAVNLGEDTDTTGCVAGGLAGVYYGLSAIPRKWIQILARHDEVESLFNRFVNLCQHS